MGRPRTGSAIQRRGRYFARITLTREPGTPPPRHEELVTRPDARPVTLAFAQAYARRLQALYDAGAWTPGGGTTATAQSEPDLTVSEWVTRWLARQTYSEAAKDRARVAAWLPRTSLADVPLRSITPRRIAAWISELRTLPNARGRPAAPRTIRNVVDPVARALRGAVFEELLDADPFASIPTALRPAAVDADPTAARRRRLTLAEVETLLGEPSIPHDRVMLYALLTLSGVRLGEAVALRWRDVVDARPLRRIVVAEQWHQRGRERRPTKTRSVREVPVHPELDAALRWWRSRWETEFGHEPTADDLLVPSRAQRAQPVAGGSRRQASVWLAFQRDLEACCLPPHRVHDLRHTFASMCVDAGMAETIAARWTHVPTATGARAVYTTASWEAQCAEMTRLVVAPRGPWRPRLAIVRSAV